MADTQTNLTIVRHGQTSANIDGVWHGSIDTPLTDHGRRQAEATGRFIVDALHPARPVGRIYASPLARARHTAEAIAAPLGLEPAVDADLAEYDLGEWEGLSFSHLFREKKLFENMAKDPEYAPHGGESPLAVGRRLSGALRRIAAAHPGERVVVVSHGGALRARPPSHGRDPPPRGSRSPASWRSSRGRPRQRTRARPRTRARCAPDAARRTSAPPPRVR